jgi:hypothetical protein
MLLESIVLHSSLHQQRAKAMQKLKPGGQAQASCGPRVTQSGQASAATGDPDDRPTLVADVSRADAQPAVPTDPEPATSFSSTAEPASGTNSGSSGQSQEDLTSASQQVGGYIDELCGVRLVTGVFGNRQGLRLEATCGPFMHKFDFNVQE